MPVCTAVAKDAAGNPIDVLVVRRDSPQLCQLAALEQRPCDPKAHSAQAGSGGTVRGSTTNGAPTLTRKVRKGRTGHWQSLRPTP